MDFEIENFADHIGIYAENIKTGKKFTLNPNDSFPVASIIKIPILYSLYTKYIKKEAFPNQEISFFENDIVGDSPYFENELKITSGKCKLKDLAYYMMIVSDNTCTNLIIDFLGFDYVNSVIKNLNMHDTFLKRKMYDFESREKGLENISTPQDIHLLLKTILRNTNKLVTSKDIIFNISTDYNLVNSSFEIIKIMGECKDLEKIPEGLKNENLIIANKPGELPFVRSDSSIIISENNNYIINIFSENVFNENTSDDSIARITKKIFNFLNVT